MINWLTYLLEVSICHALFFLVYYGFLRNLSFFQINRIFLLSIIFLGFTIPLLDIPVGNDITTDTVVPFTLNLQNLTLNEPVITESEEAVSNTNWLLVILSTIYVLGVTIRILKLYGGVNKVLNLIKTNKISDYKGIKTIYLNDSNPSFFAFFNYMFLNTKKLDITSEEYKQIIDHERVHLRNKHTLDNLLMELVIVVCWFNPILYLLKRELNHTHEFYADQIANGNGTTEDYSRLILRLSTSNGNKYLIHQFSMKNIKKRIIMLNKTKNQRGALLRYFSIVPSLIISLAVFACDYNESVPTERIVEAVNSPDKNEDIEEPPQILESYTHLVEKYFGSNSLLSDILIKRLDDDIESGKLHWSSDEIRSHMIQLFKEKNVSESDLSSLNNFLDECKITVMSNGGLKPSMVFEIPDYLRENNRSIGNVSWKGNTLYSDEYLTNYIGIKTGEVFNEEDIQARFKHNPDDPRVNDIASLYMDKGYMLFSINMNKTVSDGNVELTFEINEGDVFTVDKILIIGNDINEEEILNMVEIKEGEVFNKSKIIATINNIGESGSYGAMIKPIPDLTKKIVDIEFKVYKR